MTERRLEGLGGWLILVAINLLISLFRCLYSIFHDLLPFWLSFDRLDPNVLAMSSRVNGLFNVLSLAVIETASAVMVLIMSVWIIIFFFRKHYKTPQLFIIFNLVALAVSIIHAVLYYYYSPFMMGPNLTMRIAWAAMYCIIWIPYFVVSRRVKNTFIRGRVVES